MENLCKQVNVLREIALRRPSAHLAFLYHAPYRNLYRNKGQDLQLLYTFAHYYIMEGINLKKIVLLNKNTLEAVNSPYTLHYETYTFSDGLFSLRAYTFMRRVFCGNCMKKHVNYANEICNEKYEIDNIRKHASEYMAQFMQLEKTAIKLDY